MLRQPAKTEEMSEAKSVTFGNVTLRKVIGTPTGDELLEALNDYYMGQPTKYVVWDFTDASAKLLLSEDLQRIAKFVLANAQNRLGGKEPPWRQNRTGGTGRPGIRDGSGIRHLHRTSGYSL